MWVSRVSRARTFIPIFVVVVVIGWLGCQILGEDIENQVSI